MEERGHISQSSMREIDKLRNQVLVSNANIAIYEEEIQECIQRGESLDKVARKINQETVKLDSTKKKIENLQSRRPILGDELEPIIDTKKIQSKRWN